MTTRQELIDYCLSFPLAYEDYPFDDIADDNRWAVMRHKANKKIFAMIYERNGLCINLKCDPSRADNLRMVFKSVTPGWHMNKEHWNTVYIGTGGSCDSDVPGDELREMIEHSYDLIKPKIKKMRDTPQ